MSQRGVRAMKHLYHILIFVCLSLWITPLVEAQVSPLAGYIH